MDERAHIDRYARQEILPGLGASGQQALREARVLVIGAGGLGCPALLYLAAAGVGMIGLADFDRVEMTNLHRQTLYGPEDIGQFKVDVAARRLSAFNPGLRFEGIPKRISTPNALEVLSSYSVIIDGSDNFPTRYLVSDACAILERPLVYGAVYQYEGQVGVFHVGPDGRSTSYRDLFPEPPASHEQAGCKETGVLGAVPGIIGTWQALEAIKIITGVGQPLYNRILTHDFLRGTSYSFDLQPSPDHVPGQPRTAAAFRQTDYDHYCQKKVPTCIMDVDTRSFDAMLARKDVQLIDVREFGEWPPVTEFDCLQLPLDQLPSRWHEIDMARPVLFFCQKGIRSLYAAQFLGAQSGHPPLFHLKDGILAWKNLH